MHPRLLICPAILACSLTTYAVPPVPFSDVRLDTSRLKSWGVRDYAMTLTDLRTGSPVTRRVGRMSLACDVKKESITLTSTAKMFMPDGKRSIEFRQECVYPATNLRLLSEIKTNVVRSDGVQIKVSRSTVRGKDLETVESEGDQSSTTKSKWPKNGIVDIAAFYIVTILPREPNRRYAIDNFITSATLQKTEPRIIECLGSDRATGKQSKHWVKFSLYHPEKRTNAVHYWVSDDGVLQRVQLNKENRLDLEVAK